MTMPDRLAKFRPASRQRGISLFVSMILLAAITILTLISARSTVLELTMADNEQQRITAFEKAQAAIDKLFEDRTSVINFNTVVGHTDCTSNISSGCDAQNVTLPADDGFDGNNKAWVSRVGEAELVCPPAFLQISCADSKAAFFEFRSQYDARANRAGNVAIIQGVLSILPDQDL